MEARHDTIGETLLALASLAIRSFGRDVSLTAASTLANLERSGPHRLTDLAASEGVTQPSMTAVVSQLEHLGLAERRRHPGDGRVVLVAITAAGRRLLRTRRRAGAARFTALIEQLTEPEVADLTSALPALHRLLDFAATELDAEHRARPRRTPSPSPAGPLEVEVLA